MNFLKIGTVDYIRLTLASVKANSRYLVYCQFQTVNNRLTNFFKKWTSLLIVAFHNVRRVIYDRSVTVRRHPTIYKMNHLDDKRTGVEVRDDFASELENYRLLHFVQIVYYLLHFNS